jgi:hypothetical protein
MSAENIFKVPWLNWASGVPDPEEWSGTRGGKILPHMAGEGGRGFHQESGKKKKATTRPFFESRLVLADFGSGKPLVG